MEHHRLRCHLFWVDVRVHRFAERWLASADTPDGPTVGTADTRALAIRDALEPFSDVREELISSLPPSLI